MTKGSLARKIRTLFGGTELEPKDTELFNVVLVKLCSLGTESREGNLDPATLLTPTCRRLLSLVWVGL